MKIEDIGKNIHLEDKRFGCQIVVHRGKGKESDPEKVHFWTGLRFHIFNKYRWYFRYRCALLQVKYPMRYVELRNFDYDFVPTHEIILKRKKNLMIAQRALLTKSVNRLEGYEKNWVSLFPIEKDELYQKALFKIESVKVKLRSLEKDYEEYKLLEK